MREDSTVSATEYGRFYWCVGVATDLFPDRTASGDTEMHLHADQLDVLPDGTLLALRNREDGPTQPNFAWAPGSWRYFYAASLLDGRAVAVEHFPGDKDN